MKTDPVPTTRVTPDELLAYAEGSLAGGEFDRVQAAICASRPLFEQLRELRRKIYQRAVRPAPPDLIEEVVALESALAGPPAWQRAWEGFRQWCESVSAEAVAAVEQTGQVVRALQNTVWLPELANTRLHTRGDSSPDEPVDRVSLVHQGNSLQVQPTETGFELTIVLEQPLAGRIIVSVLCRRGHSSSSVFQARPPPGSAAARPSSPSSAAPASIRS